jgi:hypothetical protein
MGVGQLADCFSLLTSRLRLALAVSYAALVNPDLSATGVPTGKISELSKLGAAFCCINAQKGQLKTSMEHILTVG